MSIELTTIYAPKTDELFKAESKLSLLTNTDYDWSGAHSVKLWKISTAAMNDYARNRNEIGASDSVSRYIMLIIRSPPQAGSHFTSLQAAMASSLKDSTEQNH